MCRAPLIGLTSPGVMQPAFVQPVNATRSRSAVQCIDCLPRAYKQLVLAGKSGKSRDMRRVCKLAGPTLGNQKFRSAVL